MSGAGSLVGDRAVVAAPMAGGPSTWQLAAAVTRAGGIGFLAAGMRPVDRLVQDVASTRGALEGTEHAVFGVNLFVPEPANTADRKSVV